MTAYKTTKVYCASIQNAKALKNGEISHTLRAAEISAARNAKVKEQKEAAWKLLEYAYFDTCGKNIDDGDVAKGQDGKWRSVDDSFFFSLSHSEKVCAVSIGVLPCGVDIEEFVSGRFSRLLAKKILTEREFEEYEKLDDEEKECFCAKKWTEKESVFKMMGGESFVPAKISCSDFSTVTRRMAIDGREYFLSVCAEDAEKAVFEIIDDKKR